MKAKNPPKHKQNSFLYPDLLDQLDPKNPLLLLAKQIPWEKIEDDFAPLYAKIGRPAKSVRLMVGLLLLKQLENLSDERVVAEWVQNPYYQAFCGMDHFQWSFPCDPSELVHFRNRIGVSGIEKIFQASVALHGEKASESEVIVDTTVQEKNITFPTDTKLRVKVIARCWKMAKDTQIGLRRSYRRELKKLLRIVRFKKNIRNKTAVAAAKRRIKTIANALLGDIIRKLPKDVLIGKKEELENYHRAINQNKNDKNKIYSLHEPDVLCISKGKEHKKYEFGAKAAIAITKTSGLIVGVQSFAKNLYDGHTLPQVLSQIVGIRKSVPKVAFCDRGFRGIKQIGETEIVIPEPPSPKATKYSKLKARKNFGRRSAIEPIIGHLKADFRLARNYLKGTIGDTINLLLAAAAFNFKKWMNAIAARLFVVVFILLTLLMRDTESYTCKS